ncbi:MAG: hypothetical protein ACXADY_06820 [Candidatus Hodarchaeales archaeon]|jgi:hypothetical protein
MKTNAEELNNPKTPSESISPWNLAIAIVSAPLSSFLIVSFFTLGLNVISQEQWPSSTIFWPQLIYVGGIIGGTIGGSVVYWETRIIKSKNSSLSPAQLFSPDLFYLGLLFTLTYVLEMLSENLVLQGILFILEIAWFAVIGRNISKKILEIQEKIEDSDIQNKDSET